MAILTLRAARTTPAGAGRRAAAVRLPAWWLELVLVLAIYAVYDSSRLLPDANRLTAVHNGRLVLGWEQAAHLDPEHALNSALHGLPVLAVAAAYFYATMHYLVTPAVLIWLYRAHPESYRRARTWLAIATMSALLAFWLFPVAPPRMLPGAGFRDTVGEVHQWGWWSAQTSAPRGLNGLVNEFAAMPSLHVGWALWCGWLIFRHARHRIVRILGITYPMATALVVMSTGNHYLLDAIAGAVLIIVVGVLTARVGRPASGTTDGIEAAAVTTAPDLRPAPATETTTPRRRELVCCR